MNEVDKIELRQKIDDFGWDLIILKGKKEITFYLTDQQARELAQKTLL